MAIFPPEQRIWWKEPIERSEILWVVIALVW
jgi:cytochrome c oxidase subunit 2